MEIKQTPFDINYPINIFSKRHVQFNDIAKREDILQRNIYYYKYSKIKNTLLKERSELYLDLAKELKKFLEDRDKSIKILNISIFGSSLYSKKNEDFDFLVIIKGNNFSYLETKLCDSSGEKHNVGVSIKGLENLSRGLFDEKCEISLNMQSQIIYRTSISLFRRHIPLLGFDFKDNKKLFLKNGYSQVSDLLKNTYKLYYLKNSHKKLNSYKRAQKILSRMFEAVAYLSFLSENKKIDSIRKEIFQNKDKFIRLNQAKEIFNRVLRIYEDTIRTTLSQSRNKSEVLRILLDEKIKKNIQCRLENYWEISGLPSKWIEKIIKILHQSAHDEDAAVKEVRRKFPSLKEGGKGDYSSKLKRFRKVKIGNLSRRISHNIFGKIIVDVGGRSDDFAEQLLFVKKDIRKIYVTDLYSFTKRSNNSKIDFVVQSSLTSIPLKKNFADTIIVSMVLHHMDHITQKKIARSIIKTLKKGGKLILIEDSFPKYHRYQSFDNNTKEFLSFKDSEKKKILYFYDWFGNRLMRGREEISFHQEYKSMENWISFFLRRGMKLKSSEFVKENKIAPDLFPPKAIIIFEK